MATPAVMTRKERLKKLLKEFRLPFLILCSFVILGVLTFIYRRQFFEGLEALSHKLSTMGYKGYILISCIIFASAFPPIFGYATYQTLSGYTFGFAVGFPISYFSGLLGAVACFIVSRYFFHTKVNSVLAKHPNAEAIVRAVEKKGFKLFLLVRIAPHPFSIMNFVFSATNISLLNYTVGTAISLLKIALHVYIGANLTSFAKHILGEDKEELTPEQIKIEKIRYFVVFLFALLFAGLFAYIYRVAKKAVEEANNTIGDDEEQLGFLQDHDDDNDEEEEIELESHHPVIVEQPRDSMSIDNWDNWDEEDDDSHTGPASKSKLLDKRD